MAPRRTPRPAAEEAAPAVVDHRAAEILAATKRVNALAVKRKITTADRPIITTISKHADLQGPAIPTGNSLLDFLLGGGLPRGCSSKWWGIEGCGKSMAGMAIAAEVIKRGGYVLWVLAEEGSPVAAAKIYGIDIDDPHFILHRVQGSGQHAFESIFEFLLDGMIPRNLIDLVVIDSLAGLEPKYSLDRAEKDGAEKTQDPGVVARMYAEFFRKMHSTKALGFAHMMMISQARNQIGAYGDPEVSVGGKATDHAARLIFKLSRPNKGILLKGEQQIGHTVNVKITKDGYVHHLQGHKFDYKVIYSKGIDNASSYFDLALATGALVQTSSAWYETPDHVLERMPEESRAAVTKMNGAQNVRNSMGSVPGYLAALKEYLDEYIAAQRGPIAGVTEVDLSDPDLRDNDTDPNAIWDQDPEALVGNDTGEEPTPFMRPEEE